MIGQGGVPKGVVLVLIDDIGYGDIDVLYPSTLETPHLDTLHSVSVRLTDFHVGPTCSPTRGALMTGRRLNYAGVWHTIAGRELMRENEQTVAEMFQANGWKTGIFGKWHLGDGYPFAPRYRGFEKAVVHGGGGVSQGPDYYGNDYYSGVDRDGDPTTADVYLDDGVQVAADRFCTDYWFHRAKEFITAALSENKPFFCYLPTNAAHGPYNAPFGYKSGFDGLIENFDDNMGELDNYLDSLGIKDDVLLIFFTDNGTVGNTRFGELRGKKGSRYDGGHNVPCFWRWKNGGIGGSAASARDVASLTACMDLFPTFMDLFGLSKPAGGQPLHGISLREMLQNPAHVPTERTLVVDSQRQANLVKWRNTCILKDEVGGGAIAHKWRLIRANDGDALELYDFLVDRGETNDVIAAHAPVVTELSTDYDALWSDLLAQGSDYPPFVMGPVTDNILHAHSWIGENSSPWSQGTIRSANDGSRTSAVRFDRVGRYRFELRRWAREDGGALDGLDANGAGTVVPTVNTRLAIAGVGEAVQPITPGDAMSVFEMDVPSGPQTTLEAALLDGSSNVLKGAYYVYVSKVGDATDSDSDGIADVIERGDPGGAPSFAEAYDLLRFSSVLDLVAGRNAQRVGNGFADTVAAMSDGVQTYRLDGAGDLWASPDFGFGGAAANLGTLFAGPNARALMSDGTYYYLHLSSAAGGADSTAYAANEVVRFSAVADLLAGTNGVVITNGSNGSTALMSDGTLFYKVRAGYELQGTTNLTQLITANGAVQGDLFCSNNHSSLFSDSSNYYIHVTSVVLLDSSSPPPPDTDGDLTPDYLDTDSDNDGVSDFSEAGLFQEDLIDSDRDGIPDYRDNDAVPPPFVHWKQEHFERDWENELKSGALRDVDGDSLFTLSEYGLDMNPNSNDVRSAYRFATTGSNPVVWFKRNPDATDLTVSIQGATNLITGFGVVGQSVTGTPYQASAPHIGIEENVQPDGSIDVELRSSQPSDQFFMRFDFELVP
ncbi:MAG: sulfatase-like hydrolase/transferase [Kiritimatiellales bacterium]|nr:sulfatase-like hydrolase/transferase [Kiritimatiellales bacterium]